MNSIEKTLLGLAIAGALLAEVPQPPEPPEPPQAMVWQMGFPAGSGSFLGIGVAEIDNERAKALNLSEARGVEITQVEQDGPAAKAGLQKSDVVLEYNGQRVEGTEQFVRLVRETPVGRAVKLSISRNGSVQSVTATTASRKSSKTRTAEPFRFVMPEIHIPDVPKAYMGMRSTAIGIEAEPVDSQLAEFFGVKEGVLVRSVIKGSAAEKAGLKAGDVITKVEGEKVASPREITSVLRSKRGQRTLPLTVVRERREMTLNVTVEEETAPRHPAAPAPPAPPVPPAAVNRPVKN
jgi:serine protease Do